MIHAVTDKRALENKEKWKWIFYTASLCSEWL